MRAKSFDYSLFLQSLTMTSSILSSHFFLPAESIRLGRFTLSIEHPHQEYHDPPCANAPEAVITHRDGYNGLHQEASHTGLSSALTSLMSSVFSRRANMRTRIATAQVKTYLLGNSGRWFEEAMSLEVTRKWVERAIDRGDDIYIIVGFHTVSNARIIQESVLERQAGVQVSPPVGLSLTAVGVIMPLANIIDPSVSGHHQVIEGGQVQFVAPGEQVCALQYRKLCHRWLSSRRIDNAVLSKLPKWTTYDRPRGEEEGEDDIIEVEMAELEEPGGDWDRKVASSGEILLFPSCGGSISQ